MPSPSRHTLHQVAHRKKAKNASLERIVMFVAIAEPLMTLPQIIQIWSTNDAHGVSLVTWILYALASSVWLVYGLVMHSKALAVTGAIWILMEAAVIVGILLFS
jgi:uncharacterized protein with PQ loop repeat